MLFSAPLFLPFLLLVVGVFYALRFSFMAQKLWITAASLVFYGFFDARYVLLLVLITLANWGCVLLMRNRQGLRGLALVLSLIVSLGALGVFKYLGLFTDTVNSVAEAVGGPAVFSAIDIILPVGISFYIFQSLSYVIDLYRGDIHEKGTFSDFLFFVAFFPQLVAGPIVRADEFLPQIELKRSLSLSNLAWGVSFIIIGLFQKVVMADGIFAPVANTYFAQDQFTDGANAWAGVTAFTGQIYFDFSGYSSCAIGISLLFGYRLPLNFNLPYAAIGFQDFWRRWHISLSSWLRDYLYISLGGNRKGKIMTYRNLMLTMLLGGLWHGAAWTFVLWGALHGLYQVVERFIRAVPRMLRSGAPKEPGPRAAGLSEILTAPFWWLVTLLATMIAWVPFRAETFGDSIQILTAMFAAEAYDFSAMQDEQHILMFGGFFALIAFSLFNRHRDFWRYWGNLPGVLKGALLGLMVVTILAWRGEPSEFIYFQF
ncbi:MAG: MBOAT family protein [Hyphomonadaceae bacterium]|nr:MBOAT family protein [Hyphomonadaceae bacterium]